MNWEKERREKNNFTGNRSGNRGKSITNVLTTTPKRDYR